MKLGMNIMPLQDTSSSYFWIPYLQ